MGYRITHPTLRISNVVVLVQKVSLMQCVWSHWTQVGHTDSSCGGRKYVQRTLPQDNQLKPTPSEPLNTPVETAEQEMTQ